MAKATKKANVELKFSITHDQGHTLAMINNIKVRAQFLRDDIHTAAVSCVLTAIKHGSATEATTLFEALGPGYRRAALSKWFAAFAPLRFELDKNGSKEKTGKFLMKTEVRKAMLAAYEENPEDVIKQISAVTFWEHTPEDAREFEGYNLRETILKNIKRAKSYLKKKEEGIEGADKIDVTPEQIAALEAFAKTL